jgi:eukaryotic-like serine/threonine-protein kinase
MMAVPIIPGYEILTCLGGGMLTAVYSARANDTDAACVVKLLRPDWQDQPLAVKLLQREARACLAVTHRHLVKLVDTHVLTPPHFLVMEMLPGESLRSRLKRDYSVDVPTSLWIARQTAEALAALHKKGFMHGDVKPDNIRLIGDGKAILLDLGFAHRLGENASLMEAGYILGTVDYLAPELCGPEPKDDARSDIFSLGATLFEMLTGRLPYPQGSVVETLRRHHKEKPADIASFVETLPAGLHELMGRLLDPEPKQRPTAARLVQELIGLEIAALARRRVA